MDSFPDESESDESASDSTVALDLTFFPPASDPPLPGLPFDEADDDFLADDDGVDATDAEPFFLSGLPADLADAENVDEWNKYKHVNLC